LHVHRSFGCWVCHDQIDGAAAYEVDQISPVHGFGNTMLLPQGRPEREAEGSWDMGSDEECSKH
jgi:hypothetical protein